MQNKINDGMMQSKLLYLILFTISLSLVSLTVYREGVYYLKPLPQDAKLIFSEEFEKARSLEQFRQGQADLGHQVDGAEGNGKAWIIKDGRLTVAKAHNAALWLQKELPLGDLRISFTVTAHSDEGDVKCEVFGDGFNHQSGYILINGGWKNTVRAIARQDEHGEDRHNDHSCRRSSKRKCVFKDHEETWVIERIKGALYWYINNEFVLVYRDSQPLQGRHFAFNNWSAPSSFDHLKIYQLSNE